MLVISGPIKLRRVSWVDLREISCAYSFEDEGYCVYKNVLTPKETATTLSKQVPFSLSFISHFSQFLSFSTCNFPHISLISWLGQWDFMEELGTGVDRNDPGSWDHDNWYPGGPGSGIMVRARLATTRVAAC